MQWGNSKAVPTLAVTDLAKARAFYRDTLELEEMDSLSGEGDALFRIGDDSYVYVYERPTPSGSTATACSFSVQDLDRVVDALRGKGITFEEYDIPEMGLKTVDGIATQGEVRTAWFRDPFGNILAVDNALTVLSKRTGRQQQAEEV